MIIGLLEVQISIPESRSLKDKRSVLRSLKDRVMNTMNVSVAETGRQDARQFADLAFVTISAQKVVVDKRISALQNFLETNPRIVLLDLHSQIL
jgi:uncharacterized protein YlxP (DUF503 family)